MSNKKIGNEYETKFVEMMSGMGFWCHIFAYNTNGQPCDVIAVKDNKAFFFDVKHCDGDRFYTSRIEANQQSCFRYNKEIGNNTNCGFAIYFEKIGIWKYLPYQEEYKVSYHYKEL